MARPDQPAFAASLDADSEGHEGRFYVWTQAEVLGVLGPDFAETALGLEPKDVRYISGDTDKVFFGIGTGGYSSVFGTAIVDVSGMTVASIGMNEQATAAAGRSVRVIHTHPASHATYYPDAEPMSLKLIVDASTDRIVGAQAVGGAGVDKRIDVLATAMAAGLTAGRLADLELAYAPQYGSAKDPINMLGYIAQNLSDGSSRTVQWHELDDRLVSGDQLIDVRNRDEFNAGSIPGAVNIPLDDLRRRAAELDHHRPVIVHCLVGQRGHTAACLLTQLGYDAVNLDGGFRTWSNGISTVRRPQSALRGTAA